MIRDIDSAMNTITERSGFDYWRRDSADEFGVDWRFWFHKDNWVVAVDLSRFLQKQIVAGNESLVGAISNAVQESLLSPEYLETPSGHRPRTPVKPVFAGGIYKYPDGSLVLP